jgi:hypothetical protein
MTDNKLRREIMTQLTVSVPTAGKALAGLSRNASYDLAARDGSIAGIKVVRVGGRLVVPTAMIRRVLGLIESGEAA